VRQGPQSRERVTPTYYDEAGDRPAGFIRSFDMHVFGQGRASLEGPPNLVGEAQPKPDKIQCAVP
jgi:hypothetical protein